MGSLLEEEIPPGLGKVGAGLSLQAAAPSALATLRVSSEEEGESKPAVVCGSGTTREPRVLCGLGASTTRVGGHKQTTKAAGCRRRR